MTSGSFSFSISIFSSWFFHNSPIVGKIGGATPASRWEFSWSEYILSTPSEWKESFYEVSFARQFQTPDGIVCRVPGVWVLPILKYFNCCPFYQDTLNCRPPSGDQLILISRNESSSFVTIWPLSYFVKRGRFASFFHIFCGKLEVLIFRRLVQCLLKLHKPIFLSLVRSSFPWTLPGYHLNICHGRFSGL